MEEKKIIKINLSTVFLIIAIVVIAVMGYFIYKINNDKKAEIQKSMMLEAEVNNIKENEGKLPENDDTLNSNINENKTSEKVQQNQDISDSNEYDKAIAEIKKCLKDESWLKENIYISEDESINENADISDQQINFIVCKSYTKPIIIIKTSSENARGHKIDLITYENNKVKVERIDQGHIYHGDFDVDPNKCIVRSSFMHMGTTSTVLQNVADGKINIVGSYMAEEDTINSTIDKLKYKYYIDFEKGSNFDKEVTENEYNEYKEDLNEKQYKFFTIDTKLTVDNIDKYIY